MNSNIEILEARIAPATLLRVSPTVATYTDLDHDTVTVKFSKPILTDANLASILVTAPSGAGDQLQKIDLTGLGAAAAGTSITVTAVKDPTGDGLADIGAIDATGIDLGQVKISGDLGKVLAGDSDLETKGLAGLQTNSFGSRGTSTQAAGGNLASIVNGATGPIKIIHRVDGASFTATEAGDAHNTIASLTVGDGQPGSGVFGTSTSGSASFVASGDIGPIKITGDVVGDGTDSARVVSTGGKMASVKITGQLKGGDGDGSGAIRSAGDMGAVTVTGSIHGGDGSDSGRIFTAGKIGAVTIGGSLLGGGLDSSKHHSGTIEATGDIGAVKVCNVIGGVADKSGGISSGGKIASVTITGALAGGGTDTTTVLSGFLGAKEIGAVKVGAGIQGSAATSSAQIVATTKIASLDVTGDVVGGKGNNSGYIRAGTAGPIKITGHLKGDDGSFSGAISLNVGGAITITGDLVGASGAESGYIGASNVGAVKIAGKIQGSAGYLSGALSVCNAGPISIGKGVFGAAGTCSGSIYAMTTPSILVGGELHGGTGDGSGTIRSCNVGSVTVVGSITGGSNIADHALKNSGAILIQGTAKSITTGAIIAGTYTGPDPSAQGITPVDFLNNGAIRVLRSVGSLTVNGDITGNYSAPIAVINDKDGFAIARTNSNVLITVGGCIDISKVSPGPTNTALGSLTVHGTVKFTHILGGYGLDGTGLGGDGAVGGDAGIGKVVIDEDWISSTLATGVKSGDGTGGKQIEGFATGDDSIITNFEGQNFAGVVSKIASITIKGAIFAQSDAVHPNYVVASTGFAAEWIAAFQAGNVPPVFLKMLGHNDFTTAPQNLSQTMLPAVQFHEVEPA